MDVKVRGGVLPQDEIDYYIDKIKADNPDKMIKSVTLKVKGDSIDMDYTYDSKPFERIRRVTGYLAGDVSKFNDAKRAEVNDRVKHSLNTASPELHNL